MAPLRSLLFLGLFAITTLANPTPGQPGRTGPNSCSTNEFWYETKNCCLPYGGPARNKRPSPPTNKQCPPSGWYWHSQKSCCVPEQTPKRNAPAPQCNKGYGWNKGTQCCEREPTKPTTTSHSQPSQTPPGKGYNNGYPSNNNGYPSNNNGYPGKNNGKNYKRSSRLENVCPRSLEACPMDGYTDKTECVDISQELRYCGGCPSLGQGQDCTAIAGAANVGCELGTCAVYTCKLGFKRSKDGRSCEPVSGYTR